MTEPAFGTEDWFWSIVRSPDVKWSVPREVAARSLEWAAENCEHGDPFHKGLCDGLRAKAAEIREAKK